MASTHHAHAARLYLLMCSSIVALLAILLFIDNVRDAREQARRLDPTAGVGATWVEGLPGGPGTAGE